MRLMSLICGVDLLIEPTVPQDVQYADIDHYDDNQVFTIDNVAFAGLSQYFDELRRDGMRTVIILACTEQYLPQPRL